MDSATNSTVNSLPAEPSDGSLLSDISVEMASDVSSEFRSKLQRQDSKVFLTPTVPRVLIAKEKFGGSNDSIFGTVRKKMTKEQSRRSHSFSEVAKQAETERELRKAMQEQAQLRKDLRAKEDFLFKSESKIQMLLREKSSLQSNKASLEKEVKFLKRANDILRMKVNTLESSMVKKGDAIKHELAAVKCKIVSKEHELQDTKNEMVTLRKVLVDRERALEWLVKSKGAESTTMSEKIASLETTLDQRSLEMEKLRNQELSILQESLDQNKQAMALGENILALSLEDKESIIDCYNGLKAYKATLESRVADLEFMVLEKNAELAQSLIRIQELESRLELLAQDTEMKTAEHFELQMVEMQHSLRQMEKELDEANSVNALLTKNLEEATCDKHILDENLKVMTTKYQRLQEIIVEEQTKAKTVTKSLQAKLDLASSSLISLEDEVKCHNRTITEQWEQISKLMVMQDEIDKLIGYIAECKQKIGALEDEAVERDACLREVTEKLEQALSKNSELTETTNSQVQLIVDLKNSHNVYVQKMDACYTALKEEKNSVESHLISMQLQREDLVAENKDLKFKLKVETEKCLAVQLSVDQQTEIAGALKSSVDSLTDENEQLKSALAKVTQACEEAEGRVGDLASEVEEANATARLLGERLHSLSVEFCNLQTDIGALRKESCEFSDQTRLLMNRLEVVLECCAANEERMTELEKQMLELEQENKGLLDEKRALEASLQQKEAEVVQLHASLESTKSSEAASLEEITLWQERLLGFESMLEECNNMQVGSSLKSVTSMKDELERLKEAKARAITKLKVAFEAQMQKFNAKFPESNEFYGVQFAAHEAQIAQLTEECARWKDLYTKLQEKVEPFKEQLDAYQLEKNLLLGQQTEVRNELDKLSDAYAKLLGHQNQKQKIHYMRKLKADLDRYREEVFKLREQNLKQMKTIFKLRGAKAAEELTHGETSTLRHRARGLQHTNKENLPPPSPGAEEK